VRPGIAIVLALAGAVLAAPPAARAGGFGCGGVRQVAPRHSPLPGLPPLVVGDSVLLGALDEVAARGFLANARGCRGLEEALTLLTGLRRAGRLPQLIVVALGANYELRASQFARLYRVVGRRRWLALVTQRELGGWSGPDAELVRRVARAHPRQTMMLDWVRYSAGHRGWFSGDGLHLNPAGAAAFARLLGRAIGAVHVIGTKVRR
jgi:hypothetical protein